jgi:hypothetical protein
MSDEKITLEVTESGKTMDVVVFSKRPHQIQVVIGEGVHSVTCDLTPTTNGRAFAGSVMGRELVYHRSQAQVQSDIDQADPELKKFKR